MRKGRGVCVCVLCKPPNISVKGHNTYCAWLVGGVKGVRDTNSYCTWLMGEVGGFVSPMLGH